MSEPEVEVVTEVVAVAPPAEPEAASAPAKKKMGRPKKVVAPPVQTDLVDLPSPAELAKELEAIVADAAANPPPAAEQYVEYRTHVPDERGFEWCDYPYFRDGEGFLRWRVPLSGVERVESHLFFMGGRIRRAD